MTGKRCDSKARSRRIDEYENRRLKARETDCYCARALGVVMAGRRWWIPRCGAMTRKGTPCLAMPVLDDDGRPRNGRCKQHAGHSTGPRTVEGHARCLAGRQKLYDARRAAGLPAIMRKPKAASASILEAPRLPPEVTRSSARTYPAVSARALSRQRVLKSVSGECLPN
jgi:hypothetical protein